MRILASVLGPPLVCTGCAWVCGAPSFDLKVIAVSALMASVTTAAMIYDDEEEEQ